MNFLVINLVSRPKMSDVNRVADPHWFQCGSVSSFLSQCESGSRELNQCGSSDKDPHQDPDLGQILKSKLNFYMVNIL